MLSVLVLTLAVGLAASVLEESSYTGRREYVYRYMAQTVFGLPGSSRIYSGLKIVANARLQFINTSEVVAKLEDIELYAMNGALYHRNPIREQIDPDVMSRFYNPYIIKKLMLPFTFMYVRGHVTLLRTPKYEPYWSINLKRGILTMMEVNLNQRFTPYKMPMHTPVFEAYEMGASGLCKNIYTVEEPEFNPEIPRNTIVVTKTRELRNCTMRPVWYKKMIKEALCSTCDKSLGVSEGAQVRFTVKGTREHFVILSAVGESYVTVHPYKAEQGHLGTVINQTMFLIDARDIHKTILTSLDTFTMKDRFMVTTIPEFLIDNPFPFHAETGVLPLTHEMVYTEKMKIINTLKSAAESITTPSLFNTATALPVTAVSMMRRANYTVLKEIWNDYAFIKPTETPSDTAMRKVVWHCMAATGNYMSGKIILKSCVEKKLPTWACATIVNALAVSSNPNSTLIEEFITTAHELGNTDDPQLIRAVWLAIGTLTHKMKMAEIYELEELKEAIPMMTKILQTEHDPVARREMMETKNFAIERHMTVTKLYIAKKLRIVTLISTLMNKAGTDSKLLALKTAGNAGIPELIPVCEEIIYDFKQPEVVRFTAIWAMLNMGIHHKIRVIESLLPVLMRTTDTAPIRIAAFSVIFQLNPPSTVLEMLARHVPREPNLQVSSYIYSAFAAESNLTRPCFTYATTKRSRFLHMTPKTNPGIYYSKLKFWELTCPKKRIPGRILTTFGFIGSKTSIVPKALNLNLYTDMFGKSFPLFEIGLYTEELRTAMDKLFGPEGVLTNRKSFLDILSPRMKRSTGKTHYTIEEIMKKIGLNTRKMPLPTGLLHMKIFGHEMRYWTLDEFLRKLAVSGKISTMFKEEETGITLPIEYYTSLYLGEISTIVPTDAGIPIHLKLVATTAVRTKGITSVKVTPALFESRRQRPPVTAAAFFNIHSSSITEVSGHMYTDIFHKCAGTSLIMRSKVNLPLVGNVTANLPRKKLMMAIVPPIKREPIIELEAFPMTFQTLTPVNQRRFIEIAEGARIVETLNEYGNDTLGINSILVRKRADTYGNPRAPIIPMSGRSVLQWFVRRGPYPPEYVVLQTQIAPGVPLKPRRSETGSASDSSCDCTIGRLTLCMVACKEEDVSEPEMMETGPYYEDFPNLMERDITIGALKTKMQTKLGTSMRLSPVGHKWGMITTIDASTPRRHRKLQFEALWQAINFNTVHQFVLRVTRSPLPPAKPEPYEMMTSAMIQFPNRVVDPRSLLDYRYQRQLHKDLMFMTRFANHRPILAYLNSTVVTMLKEQIQMMTADPRPLQILRSLAFTVFDRYNETVTGTLIPIWRRLIKLNVKLEEIWHRGVDPIYLVKHMETLKTFVVELEKTQMMMIPMFTKIPFPTDIPYMFESCLLEHYKILTTLADITYRASKMTTILPHADAIYSKVVQLLEILHEKITEHAPNLAMLRPPPETVPMPLRKVWPRIQILSTTQMNVMKEIIRAIKTSSPPSMQPIIDMINKVSEALPVVVEAFTSEELTLHIVPVMNKLAIEHCMIEKALTLLVERLAVLPETFNRVEYVHVIKQLKTQATSLASTSATTVKFRYDFLMMKPLIPLRDLTTLKKLHRLQVITGVEMARIFKISSYTPLHSSSIEVPEQPFTGVEEIIHKIMRLYKEMEVIVRDMSTANIEPNVIMFEKTTMTVMYLRDIVKTIRAFMIRNTIITPETARCLVIIRECEKLSTWIEELEVMTTAAFEKIWSTASEYEEKTPSPVTKKMIDTTLTSIVIKQEEVLTEINHFIMELKRVPITTANPWIDTLLFTVKGLQNYINWCQLWGIPFGRLNHIYAKIISTQHVILKKIREVITLTETRLERPAEINFLLIDLETELSRIIKIGSVEMSGIEPPVDMPVPHMRHMPYHPSMPYSRMPYPWNIHKNPEMNSPYADMKYPPYNKWHLPDTMNPPYSRWHSPIKSFVSGLPHDIPVNPMTKLEASFFPLAFTGFVNVSFGVVGMPLKNIYARMYAIKSFEQILWETKQINIFGRDPNVEIAIARQEAAALYDYSDNPMYAMINSLKHRHLTVEYNPHDIPKECVYWYKGCINSFMSRHYWQTTITPPVHKIPGVVSIVNEGKMNSPASDTFVMSSNMTVAMRGVNTYLTTLTSPYCPVIAPWLTTKIRYNKMMGPNFPPHCMMNFDDIRTFDGVEYMLPEIGTCPVVLAMDCSPKKEFAITLRYETRMTEWKRPVEDMSPVEEPMMERVQPRKKILHIHAEGKTIIVATTMTGAAITVDDTPITITPTKTYVYEKTVQYGEKAVAIRIIEHDGYLIELPLLGLYVYTNGHYINVQASTIFKMKTCGLCSNMDGERRFEFEAADGRVYYTPEPFVASYMIRGPTCPTSTFTNSPTFPMLETIRRYPEPEPRRDMRPRAMTPCTPIPMHLMKYKKSENKICFSVPMVPRCPDPCRVKEGERSEVGFYCVPMDSPEARTIKKEINDGRPMMIKSKTPNTTMTIMRHMTCK